MSSNAASIEIEITHEMPSYNDRRYQRPWIARVVAWPIGQRPVLEFGTCAGDRRTLLIAAAPGEALYYGQKDLRGGNTLRQFAEATAEGGLVDISEAQARAKFR